ncbi:MAG: hypothetical protein ACRYFS_03970 [Janthinobacterium lividum]
MPSLLEHKSSHHLGGFYIEYGKDQLTIHAGFIKRTMSLLGSAGLPAFGLACLYGTLTLFISVMTEHGVDERERVSEIVCIAVTAGLFSVSVTAFGLLNLWRMQNELLLPVIFDKNANQVLRQDKIICQFDAISKIRVTTTFSDELPTRNTILLRLKGTETAEIVLYDYRLGLSWPQAQAIARAVSSFVGVLLEINDT